MIVDVPLPGPPRTEIVRDRSRAGRPQPIRTAAEAEIGVEFDDDGGWCTIPCAQCGPGITVITGAGFIVSGLAGEQGQARTPNLPSGETTRIDFWIPPSEQQWWPPLVNWIRSRKDAAVEVTYTDLAGEQQRRTLLMLRFVQGQESPVPCTRAARPATGT